MEKLTIIKVGGKVVEDNNSLQKLLSDFNSIEGLKILIHGGGNIATDLAKQLGLEVQMVNGRRITNTEMLDLVIMVYGGLINKNIVAGLQALGCDAIGLTGTDLNIIQAIKRPVKDIDYGLVGDIVKVNGEALKKLLENNFIPIIAPLTHDKQGQIFNTNADDITNAIAKELSNYYEVKLIFCFDKKGVMKDIQNEESIIPKLSKEEFNQLVNDGIINEGMIPKIENGFSSLENGVKQVFITNVEGIGKVNPGGTELII